MSTDRPDGNDDFDATPWDVVVASDSDPREVLGLPPDAPFPFRGPLPLSLNPATNNLTTSDTFLRNPMVRDRYFFTLPRNLWDDVYRRIGEGAYDQAAAHFEGIRLEFQGAKRRSESGTCFMHRK